jgi:hypothetical protein
MWRPAFEGLLARIASEEVKVIGLRKRVMEPVPGYHFASCQVDYPFQDTDIALLFSEEFYLRSIPYYGEARWRDGCDDALTNTRSDGWRRLMVLKADVARHWPFGLASEVQLNEASRTGAPGRPSSMHLIEAEFAARSARGERAGTLAEESRILAHWLRSKHPNEQRAGPKAIENKLRQKFRGDPLN